MSTVKVSASLDSDAVVEAKSRVGERGLSRFLNEALAMRLQWERLADLEHELEAEFGPIPEAARRKLETMEWPR